MNSPFEVFRWNDSLETGIPEVDKQHQILVQFLNTLASSLTFHTDIPSPRIIFMELADYAVYHFQTEERIWREFFGDDPMAAKHKNLHNDFVSQISSLQNNSEPLEVILQDVVTFLTNWLTYHILESDKQMAKVALAVQSGLSLEQAKQRINQEMITA